MNEEYESIIAELKREIAELRVRITELEGKGYMPIEDFVRGFRLSRSTPPGAIGTEDINKSNPHEPIATVEGKAAPITASYYLFEERDSSDE